MLLASICYLYINMNPFYKSSDDTLKIDRKLEIRNYRLLAKYQQKKGLNIIELNEDIGNKVQCDKEATYNNKNLLREKKKKSNKYPLNKAQYYTEFTDYNNGIFDGKYFHFEKKWIKKEDYDNFLKKKRIIHDTLLKKIKFRSYGFGVVLFIFFLLLGIGLPILRGIELGKDAPFKTFSYIWKPIYKAFSSSVSTQRAQVGTEAVPGVQYFYLVLFSVLMIILAVLVIVFITKILRNNEKYKKIKYMTE
ncbi:Plasmodium exported protein (Pm-fam-a like), unknown function [Plasmodium malariae]|uniref:Fam-m protein n=1 Tax=Plasmodium malariae TaxID=5858 RepID=A0A1A8XAX4_PLAMA|nr:Plasmodium exported protein (Pm-fam-a like), unknown function [Plasmodium malariae]